MTGRAVSLDEIAEAVGTLDDGELTELIRIAAEEIETRMMQRAGEVCVWADRRGER